MDGRKIRHSAGRQFTMTMYAETVFIDTIILVYATNQKSDLQTKLTEMLPWLNITPK